jgi:hypothetical protein
LTPPRQEVKSGESRVLRANAARAILGRAPKNTRKTNALGHVFLRKLGIGPPPLWEQN